MQHGVRPTIYYCNPNIFPLEEYLIRKDECTRYAQALGLDIVDADYDHEAWKQQMKGMEQEPERGARCLSCFRLRLLSTASYAASQFDDVTWWDHNWRKGGLSERRLEIIREYGFYNQQYCGCEYSMRRKED